MHPFDRHPRATLLASLVALVAALLAVAPLTPAHAERTRVVDVQEDCHEVAIPRAVSTAGLRPLVPERYGLLAVSPSASRLMITTVTCASVWVEPGGDRSPARRTTFTIGAAQLTSSDGGPSDDYYLLWYGTDNAEEAAKLRQLGLPVTFQPHTTSAITEDGGSSSLSWDIRGGGLDYTIEGTGAVPVGPVATSELTWVHDGPEGRIRMTYANRLLPASRAVVTADLTRLQPLLPILVAPARPTDVPFTYLRGGWTLTAEVVD